MKQPEKKEKRGGLREGAGRPSEGRRPYSIRFRQELIEHVDDAAEREGITRTAWIEDAIEKKLDEAERDDPSSES